MPKFTFEIPGPEHAELILEWRRKPWVERNMYTKIEHGVEEQRRWLENCLIRKDYRHWLAKANGRPIGLINLQKIDWKNRTSATGYYIGEDDARPLSGFIPLYVYNHAFFDLGMEKVTGEVIEGNEIMRFNRKVGFREQLQPNAVLRDGVWLDIIKLTLSREDWEANTQFHRFQATFPWPVNA